MDVVNVRWSVLRGFEFHVEQDSAPDSEPHDAASVSQSAAAPLQPKKINWACFKHSSRLQSRSSAVWAVWTSPMKLDTIGDDDTADTDASDHAGQVECMYERIFLLYSGDYLKRTSVFWAGLMFVLSISTLMPMLSVFAAAIYGIPERPGAGFDNTITNITWTLKGALFCACFPVLLVLHA